MPDPARVEFEKALLSARVGEWLACVGRADWRFADGVSPAEIAVRKGASSALKRLLAAGADARERDAGGRTLLHLAVDSRSVATLMTVLDCGLSANDEDKAGITPLALAIQNGDAGCVSLLLKAGASATHATVTGLTPLHFLAMSPRRPNRADAAGQQYRAMQDDRPCFSHVNYVQAFALARMLMKAGARMDARDAQSRTALDVATMEKHDAALSALLVADAGVTELGLDKLPEDWVLHVAGRIGHAVSPLAPGESLAKTATARFLLYLCHHRSDEAPLPKHTGMGEDVYYALLRRSSAWWMERLPAILARPQDLQTRQHCRIILDNPEVLEDIKETLWLVGA